MKDIFLHRLKNKDAFLRNAGVVHNTIFYRAIFPDGNKKNVKFPARYFFRFWMHSYGMPASCVNEISTERYSLTGINSRFSNNNFKRDIVKMIVFRRNTSFDRKNTQFSSRNPIRNTFYGRYNMQLSILHSVRNASLGRICRFNFTFPCRDMLIGRYNVRFTNGHSVRNASLGRTNRQSLTLHSVGMHPQNQQQCYLK